MTLKGSIPKHRWEVCSMKSPWVFQVDVVFRLALECTLFLLAVAYTFLLLNLLVYQVNIPLHRMPQLLQRLCHQCQHFLCLLLLLSMPATVYPGDKHGHTAHEIFAVYLFWLLGIDYVEVVVIFLFCVVVL